MPVRSTEHTDYFEKAFGQTYDLLNSSSSTQDVNPLTQISINHQYYTSRKLKSSQKLELENINKR